MGIFRKATRLDSRVAKNAARQIVMPEDEKSKKSKGDKSAEPAAPQHSDAEYDELQEKYNALMIEKWKEYYKTSCDGECETCEYYDWCPDDFDGVFEDDADDAKAESAAAEGEGAVAPDVDECAEGAAAEEADEAAEVEVEDEDDEAVEVEAEEENDVELTDEERAAKAAAEAEYEEGCDGDCDNCEHYDWCPAEEEDEDDKVLFKGVTQGDVKNAAKGGVELARETALAARDLKEALDDITGGMNLKELLK